MPKSFARLSAALLLMATAGAASAAERVLLGPGATVSGKSGGLPAAAKETERGAIAKLRTRAAKDGKVRVVVGYRVPFAPESQLNAGERAQQRGEIAAATGSLRKKFAAASKRAGGLQPLGSVPFAVMNVTRSELDRLQADPGILTIVEDQPMAPQLTYSVPLIAAPVAWQAGATGAGQTVAVIDQGTQTDHPFLRDDAGRSKVVYEAHCSPVCTPGKGKAAWPDSRSGSATHGTSVSGIIVGERAKPALTGVAPDANLMVFRVYYTSDLLSAMQKVYELRNQYRIAAVSMSLGVEPNGPGSCDTRNPAMTAIIKNLREAGIATVVAAGNNSNRSVSGWPGTTDRLMFPACISSAVSVGAIYPGNKTGSKEAGTERAFGAWSCNVVQPIKVDEVACFSNTSPGLSLLAPGFPTETSSLNGSYNLFFGGTSAATPHVAGAFAALRSKVPSATVSQILEALRATGKPVRDFRTGLTTPRIDVARALDYLQGNATATAAIDYTPTGDGSGTVSFAPTGSASTCTGTCTNAYPAGTRVTITAQPNPGMQFLGWNGECKGTDTSCTVTLSSAATRIGASFGRTCTITLRSGGLALATFQSKPRSLASSK